MGYITQAYKKNETLKKIIIVILTGFTSAIALNMFLIPANVFSAGVNGISQLLSSVIFELTPFRLDTGILIFLLNIPIAILGWIKIGKEATIYSLLAVLSVSLMTLVVPVHAVSDNPLMNAIIGGVLMGAGTGTCLKYGFSTGGMDIISMILAKTTGRTVGSLMLMINFLIVIAAGFLFTWESALYTIISIYGLTQVVDMIHTSHQKITAMIMTHKPDATIDSIQERLVRGMTLLPAIGAYSRNEGRMIMIVITRYELYDLEQAVYDVDPDAFVNIIPTQSVLGKFWNEDEQKVIKSSKTSEK